jgi:hypothetical protein
MDDEETGMVTTLAVLGIGLSTCNKVKLCLKIRSSMWRDYHCMFRILEQELFSISLFS